MIESKWLKKWPILAVALICLSLTTLSGCGRKIVLIKPDPRLTGDCAYPVAEGQTYRDYLKAYEARGLALKQCTTEKRALRSK